ncbi:FtsX-like permease family protein [Sphaerochaeta sp. PS]|uniref:ABC transporter permease n=1 Tax=Sphaerochaeta sp. PS TaxID=3076336 RepID=UPI0028A3E85B|nr:FtsX-like permease family protein [Sphaerochaeta sp. PS]MDT4760995.1 FtsX-like permease family protein [Sphaerochaeta sp. PS]
MKFIFTLAMKNLTRYKRRTAITATAIALGLMMYLVVDSLLMGIEQESERNLIWYETSSVRIHQKEYWPDRLLFPLETGISNPEKAMEALKKGGYTATGRTMFKADMILSSDDFGEEGNLPALVTAIDPETDNQVFHFEETLAEGRLLTKGEKDGMLMGSWLAEDIGAKVGYWVTLVTRGNGGFFEAVDLQIVGILNCPNPNVNRTLIMVDKENADAFLGMEGSVTEIDIRLPSRANVETEVTKIQASLASAGLGDLEAQSWRVLAKDFLAIAEAKRGGSGIILFLVFIIAAVGISNTMLMAMYERTRELGMMRALGMKDNDIRLSFIFEAGGIGLVGSLMGIILGALLNIFIANVGINMGFLLRDIDMGYRIQSIMRGTWSIRSFVITFISGIALSMLVSIVPIRRALKMDIPSCLRHQ